MNEVKWEPVENFFVIKVMKLPDGAKILLEQILNHTNDEDLKNLANAARMTAVKFPSVAINCSNGKSYYFENTKKKYITITRVVDQNRKYVAIVPTTLIKLLSKEIVKWAEASATDFDYRSYIFDGMVSILQQNSNWSLEYYENPMAKVKEYVRCFVDCAIFGNIKGTYKFLPLNIIDNIQYQVRSFKSDFYFCHNASDFIRYYSDNDINHSFEISHNIFNRMMHDLELNDLTSAEEDKYYITTSNELSRLLKPRQKKSVIV